MNKRNVILQAAVVAAFAAAGVAHAATLTATTQYPAVEIWGNGTNSPQASTETLMKIPPTAHAVGTPVGAYAAQDTFKFTLGGGAVFGAQVTAAQFSVMSASLGGSAGATGVTIVSGGAIGDNTVIIKLGTAGGGGSGAGASIAQPTLTQINFSHVNGAELQVKNLTTALATLGGTVQITSEVSGNTPGTVTDPTTAPLTIFQSVQGVTFSTNDAAAAGSTNGNISKNGQLYHSINVADASKKFSLLGSQSFSTTTSVTQAVAGTITFGLSGTAKNETGTPFGFAAGDVLKIAVNGTAFPSFQSGMGVYLKKGGACATTDTAVTAGVVTAGTKSGTQFLFTVPATDFPASGASTTYNVCATTDNTNEIDETTIASGLTVDFFNNRYVDGTRNPSVNNLEGFLKNGVTQTLPYLLNQGNRYQTYVRVVNTGSVTGKINVSCLKNNGGAWTTGTLASSLAPYKAILKTPADVVAACGTNGAADSSEYSYVRIVGEVDAMDAIEFMVDPVTGGISQFSTWVGANN